MITVKVLVGDDRKYCTHCDNRAVYELFFTNPVIVQQGSNGALCERCMRRLEKAIAKVTSPNSTQQLNEIKANLAALVVAYAMLPSISCNVALKNLIDELIKLSSK
jgi:hypothetical protein